MAGVSFIVPAYNEAESIPKLWERLKPVALRYPDWEVIIVNDGSTDQTAAVVQGISSAEPRVRLLSFANNRGKSAVLTAGFRAASGEIVVTLDADLQDEPEEIPHMIELLEQTPADMVGGWKKERRDPLVKRISSKIFNTLANRIMRTDFHDLNCGLKVYRSSVVKDLDLYGDLYRFIPLLVVARGYRAIETPVKHSPRLWGKSKYGLRLNGAFDLISLIMLTRYRFRPLHFFGSWGVLFILIGLGLLIYLAVLHFLGQSIGDRPLLIFAVLFVMTGFQMIFTGLLADLVINRQTRS